MYYFLKILFKYFCIFKLNVDIGYLRQYSEKFSATQQPLLLTRLYSFCLLSLLLLSRVCLFGFLGVKDGEGEVVSQVLTLKIF